MSPYGLATLGLLAAVLGLGLALHRAPARLARIGLIALAVATAGLMAWPWWRHVFDGQSLFLIESWSGSVPLDGTRSPLIVPPLMELLAASLGALSLPAWTLVLVSALAGAVYVAVWAGAAWLLTGRWSMALLVSAALLLDPQRLAWSHAAYHVIHPATCVGIAALLMAEGGRRGSTWIAFSAGLWVGVAAGLRLDALTSLAPLAALAFAQERPARRLVGLGGGTALGLVPVLLRQLDGLGGAGWSSGEAASGLATGLGATESLGPWASVPVVLSAVVILILGRGSYAPLALLLVGCTVAWTGLATFIDLGARHTLALRGFAALAAALLLMRVPSPRRRAGQAAAAVVVLALAIGAINMRARYMVPLERDDAPPAWVGPTDAIQPPLEDRLGCGFVALNAEHFETWRPSDHLDLLELLDPLRARAAWERHDGCVIWLRDHDDWRWDDTTRWSRSRRLAHLWRWERLGAGRDQFGGWLTAWQWQGPNQSRSWITSAASSLAPALVGIDGPREECLAAAAATCRWIAACAPEDPGLDGGDHCRQVLEEGCTGRRPGVMNDCAALGVACERRARAETCWTQLSSSAL